MLNKYCIVIINLQLVNYYKVIFFFTVKVTIESWPTRFEQEFI